MILNDGSTDNSAAICDEYSSLDSRIRVFHKPNDGPASAKNFGLERAQGEYIIFLNADDFWTNKDGLDTLVNIADSTKADIVKGEFKVIGFDGKEIRKERHRKIFDKKILSRKLFFGKCLDGEFSCFQFLVRRESMSGLTFDESFTFDEDAELASRYFRKKVKCAYSAKYFYAVRLHSHSLTASYKNSNLNCAFSLPLYFFRCSHGLRAGLRRTYRRYSVMLYYRALVMMSEGKYYDDRSTIIKALNLDAVHSKTVSVMFKCWIFTRHFICILASPKVGASLIRFKKNFRPHKGKDISKVNYTGREA